MSLVLQTADLEKSYNGRQVLDGCSWTFDRGGIYVLTGPNGSGKSSFLRISALLEKPDRGKVSYFDEGNQVQETIALMRRITLVLPRASLFSMSVFDNVSYGLRIRGIPERQARSRTEGVLEFVGLGHRSDQYAPTLSSGEAQRIAMARALVIEPEVLFLDEPTASVDEKNTLIIEDIIRRLRRDRKTTVIMTTHDRAQAERLGDRVLLLQDGRIV